MNRDIGVVALVPEPWDHIAFTTRHHVLSRLAQHFNVLWVEPDLYWRDYFSDPWRYFGRRRGVPSVPLLRRSWLAPRIYRPRWLAAAIYRRRLMRARRILERAGAQRIVLYLWRPECAPALDLIDCDMSCYHIDDEYSFSTIERSTDPAEAALVQRVHRVFCVSRALARKKGFLGADITLVPNGVDYTAYSTQWSEPADLAAIPRPRVGYVGVIKKQLDLPLVVWLAKRHLTKSFVFVGPVGAIGNEADVLKALRALPNVYFLGRKPVEQLPAYVQHMDVNMLLHKVDDYTKYIYPLKLHEYLATGRSVVSSDLEAVREFGDVVRIARSPEEWSAWLNMETDPARSTGPAAGARQAVAAQYDWDVLVGGIADSITSALLAKQMGAVACGRGALAT